MRRLAAVAALLALCACGTTAPAPETTAKPAEINWGACEKIAPSAGFQCATMEVPLDYTKPGGKTIGIALIRLRATGPGAKLGSLVLNFGGPGGSGVSTLTDAAAAFRSLGGRYDLVSFDPRGVERSEGVRCMDPKPFEAFLRAEPSLDVAIQTRLLTEFAQACQKHSGEILPYVGTLNAVRDMEMLRVRLGDPKLNFLGFSYGTHLGALYATQFPKVTGRMVLDAAVDPALGLLEQSKTQVKGFQRAYENYLADCARQDCPFNGNTAVLGLISSLRRNPLNVQGRLVTDDVARVAIAEALYSELTWPLLTQAIADAIAGNGAGLLNLSDSYAGRQPDGSYNTLQSSLIAILCADTTDRPSVQESVSLAKEMSKKSPIFGPDVASAGGCSVWPTRGEDSNKHIDARGSGPIVVIGTTNDPATPYEWAPKLTEQLGTGVLLTLKGEGHGAYGQNTCIDTLVDAYFLNGKVPDNGTVCP
ncbi:alpha/beta hydrolase [Acrocarpospora macrocephala]|uniref:Peptidase n=1 Tax=Acrocarpospora macrocephala TaxID=150177 RepID=A0A5M3WKE3_9ACTN|nr:alpha/beta hydrolase [Acrocarpospora macrocephala]GES06878.1 peptidase [Acrocarpospora macrocephala]